MKNWIHSLKKVSFSIPVALTGVFALSAPLHAKDLTAKEVLEGQNFFNHFSFFDDFPRSSFFTSASNTTGINLYEEDDQVIVEANLPGLKAENIEVTYNRGSLWIKGKKEESEQNDQRNYYHRSSNSYAYAVDIPGVIDESQSPVAEYENGVMKIKFLKSEQAMPKRIEIVQK